MQNVDQFNRFPSFSQLPSELHTTHFGAYPTGVYQVPITGANFGQPYRHLTPSLEDQVFQYAPSIPIQQLPTPPSSPGPYNYTPQRYNPYEDRLRFQKVLGSGAYAVVHLAEDVSTGRQYAVKALNKFMPNGCPLDQRQQQFQQTEMRLHHQVSAHPNIVSLLRIKDSDEHTYVIMDYCPEGDLFSNITEKGRYVGNDDAAKAIFLQILDAVAYCHSRGVYHRDLKPENILVTDGGSQVKLADFGLATTEAYATEFGCGSTFYMSPECQDQTSGMQYYACAPNDIWSLGVILVNLTCGRNPWKSASPKDSTFRAYMEDRQFLKSILPLSDELNAILGMIFEMDPTRRIKLDDLRQRIISCPRFTKATQEVSEPVYDYESYELPLSPASTLSDEGTMVSSGSDSSTASSTSSLSDEDDLDIEIMDDDSFQEAEFFDAVSDVKVIEPEHWTGDSIPDVLAPTPPIVDSGMFHQPQEVHPSQFFQGHKRPRRYHDITAPPTPPYEDTHVPVPRLVSQSPSNWVQFQRFQSSLHSYLPPRVAYHG